MDYLNSVGATLSSAASSGVSSVSGLFGGAAAPAAAAGSVSPLAKLPRDPKALPGDVDGLRKVLSDPSCLLLPADGDAFLRARFERQWNLDEGAFGVPSALALPATEGDVVQLVKFASAHSAKGLRLGVACGRHSHHAMENDALVIDLQRFNTIDVDAEKRIAKVGGGCLLGAVDEACRPHGLGVTFGHDPSTGVGGLTLHGGQGFLQRVYGLSVDNLLAMRVVLASGLVVNTSEKEHPDLFWALRGGSGNFGIVLSFTFQLHKLPEDGMFVAGARVHMPFWPLPNRAALLDHFHAVTRDAPDEYSSALALTPMPVVHLNVWVGSREQGRAYMEKHVWPVGWPVADDSKSTAATGQSYHTVVQRFVSGADGKLTAPAHYFLKGILVGDLSAEFKAMLLECYNEMPSGSDSAIILILLGGKSARVPGDATAVAVRDAKYWVLIQAAWARNGAASTPELRAACVSWVRKSYDRMSGLAVAVGKYGSLPDPKNPDEPSAGSGPEDKFTIYGDNLPRLRTVKKKYDPRNVFCVNANLLPAK